MCSYHNFFSGNKRSMLAACVGSARYKSAKYKKVGVLPIRIVKSNVSSVAVGPSSATNSSFCLMNADNFSFYRNLRITKIKSAK